jgi:protein-L-isoaspartate(D-aspartate) O-methyltransferase
MADYAVQRSNMVESQVRTADVTDRRILRAMLEVPREAFAPGAAEPMAYADAHLPVSDGATQRFLLAPRTLAKLIQLLEIDAGDAVLDVGCASGYSTAILARLAGRVVGVEPDPQLAARARETLSAQRIDNAVVLAGSVVGGAPDEGPFDAILINGSMARRPEELFDQMKDGGRLAAILADGPVGKATVWHRRGAVIDGRPAFDAGAPALAAFDKAAGFFF